MASDAKSAALAMVPVNDERGMASLIASLVVSGDVSRLDESQLAWYYRYRCAQLGLDPASKPFDVLLLNGKKVLYLNRYGADQLARIHKVNRRVVEGPKVIDLAGTKMVYALIEASTPDGRTEQEVSTVPLSDPLNALMKCVSKGKRRATIAITSAGALAEDELETIPESAKGIAAPIHLGALEPAAPVPATALDRLRDDLCSVETREGLRAAWHEHRAEIVAMDVADDETHLRAARELMWQCAQAQGLARTKKELAAILAGPTYDGDGPRGGAPKPAASEAAEADPDPERASIQAADAAAPADTVSAWKAHVATKKNAHELSASWRKHRGEWGAEYEACTEATLDTLCVLLATDSRLACMNFLSSQARKRAA